MKDRDGYTVLLLTKWTEHEDVINLLMENGADPNIEPPTWFG